MVNDIELSSIQRMLFMNDKESWQVWHDDYQDYWEAKGNYAEEFEQDDIEEYKRLRDEEK